MSTILIVLMGTVLVNTFWLLERDAGLGGTRKDGSIANAIRIGAATGAVLVIGAVAANLAWGILVGLPRDLLLFVFALSVVAATSCLHIFSETRVPSLARGFAGTKLLIVSNSLALGTCLLEVMAGGPASTFFFALVLALFFAVALSAFTALIARLALTQIPSPFRIAPITLISAGLLTLALMGFAGILRG